MAVVRQCAFEVSFTHICMQVVRGLRTIAPRSACPSTCSTPKATETIFASSASACAVTRRIHPPSPRPPPPTSSLWSPTTSSSDSFLSPMTGSVRGRAAYQQLWQAGSSKTPTLLSSKRHSWVSYDGAGVNGRIFFDPVVFQKKQKNLSLFSFCRHTCTIVVSRWMDEHLLYCFRNFDFRHFFCHIADKS